MTSLILTLAILGSGELDASNLTPTQKAEIQLQIEKLKTQKTPDEKVAEAREWVELGTAIGQALSGSARELGIAVNEFSDTKVGQITTVLIVWKLIGKDLVGFIVGAGMLAFLLPTWWFMYRRVFLIEVITYGDPEKHNFKKRIQYSDEKWSEGRCFMACLFGIFGPGIMIAAVVIMLV